MMPPPASPFTVFCQKAFDFLDGAGLRHLVIGGLAVGAIGEARTTGDVDVIGYASPEEALALITKAAEAGFDVHPETERERLRATGTLRFRHGPFQLDIILASLPFEEAAHSRAIRRRLFGRLVPFPTPEDLIVFKVLAGRDKDLLDAIGVARRHLPTLDRRYLDSSTVIPSTPGAPAFRTTRACAASRFSRRTTCSMSVRAWSPPGSVRAGAG